MYAIQAQKVTKRYRNGAQALENFSVQVREERSLPCWGQTARENLH